VNRIKHESNEPLTKGFVQLGLDGAAIISSTYPGFSFGGPDFCGAFVG
jgi:hypothetical protein